LLCWTKGMLESEQRRSRSLQKRKNSAAQDKQELKSLRENAQLRVEKRSSALECSAASWVMCRPFGTVSVAASVQGCTGCGRTPRERPEK
jgi:ElaB/YqjD/DUF883 family membrane-anchored ribosome-binding protein